MNAFEGPVLKPLISLGARVIDIDVVQAQQAIANYQLNIRL